jgi:2'-5' RNA ligase
MSPTAPLIVTLKLDAATFAVFDELRQHHFPPERNFLPAHITLFHALPGAQEASIQTTLAMHCAGTPALRVEFPRVRSLGRGVAVTVECPALLGLREQLANAWQAWLGAQDRQPYRPHLTIQNKVTADEARQLHDELAATWQPLTGTGEGLLLWRYLGGPWEAAGEFAFQTTSASTA